MVHKGMQKPERQNDNAKGKKKYVKPTVTDLDDAFALIEPMGQTTCSTVAR